MRVSWLPTLPYHGVYGVDMSLTDVLAVVAASFGIGMGASPLLQAARAHRRQSSADVSLTFLVVLFGGAVAWLSYGIALGNPALIVGNSVGVVGSATALAVTHRWRDRRPALD
jgi:uncharacterized protein with PQ loop repeat